MTARYPETAMADTVGSKRILIVEDYYALADQESFLCSMEGYEVRIARSGNEGLQVFGEFHPDLVLLDLVLPGDMDGMELLDHMLAANGHSPRVLVVSARLDPETKKDLESRENVHTLRKPFKLNDLAARINDILG